MRVVSHLGVWAQGVMCARPFASTLTQYAKQAKTHARGPWPTQGEVSNGAGKSTTAKILTGLLQPAEGQILWNGKDISRCLVEFKT